MSGTVPSFSRVLPGSWRTWRDALTMRNSSSTLTDANSGSVRSRPASSAAGSGSRHSSRRRSAGIRFSASAHEAASKTYQSCTSRCASTCSMSSASVQIWCCRDHVDRRRRHHLVVVIDQLEQRLLDVPRPGLDQHVAAPHFFFDRQVFEQRHDPLAQLAAEDVVEILRGARAAARIAVLQRPLGRGDVLPRIDQGQQPIDAVLACAPSSAPARRPAASRSGAVFLPNRLWYSER